MVKFSLIVPCYNVSKYIRECLESVLAQSEPSWEAICTDDGSTDETGRILEEYAAKDSRIKVIHQANGGLSAARNAALKVAIGEWLCYLDGDDMLTPWALETYVKMEQQFPQADILRAGMCTFEDGAYNLPARENFDAVGVDLSLEVPVYGIDGYFQQMVYRRALLGDIPFVGMSWCEERPYVAKCLARAKFGTNTNTKAYCFRKRMSSISHTAQTLEQNIGYLNATVECVHILVDSGKQLSHSLERLCALNLTEKQISFVFAFLSKKDRKLALVEWRRSLRELDLLPKISLWLKWTAALCRAMPLQYIPRIVYYGPWLLKTHGFHR